MGNASVRELAAIEPIEVDALAGSVVAVDAHNWLYKYLTTTVKFTDEAAYTAESGEEVANLIGIVQGLPTLLEADVTPVFVFDGVPTDLKDEEIAARREERERAEERLAAAREAGDEVEAARLESRTQRLTGVIHETTRGLFDRLDVPYLEAPAEGEAQCAHMARHDPEVDYAGSDDYDTLLFGAPRTLRQLTGSGDPEVMDLAATLEGLDLTWEGLVDAGILMGTDFNDGVDGMGPKTAVAAVREHGDLWGVLEAEGETIEHAERVRELFLQPDVETGYDLGTELRPDMEAAREYVTGEWEVPAAEVDRGFERIETATTQTGLDRFT
ncbi:MAG: flap endonuclease-1 [Halobacteriales archaeon]